MRIETWNLEGRWSLDCSGLLAAQECDVWLLTEVPNAATLPGFETHLTSAKMSERKHWAGIFSRAHLQPLPDPHPASAAALGGGLVWCGSILPWRSCGTAPWGEGTTSQKTIRTLRQTYDDAASRRFGVGRGLESRHARRRVLGQPRR